MERRAFLMAVTGVVLATPVAAQELGFPIVGPLLMKAHRHSGAAAHADDGLGGFKRLTFSPQREKGKPFTTLNPACRSLSDRMRDRSSRTRR